MSSRLFRSPADGQSLTEFALVIPILVILFVGIADFGRVFQTSITLEAATRDAAEAAANAYIASPPGPLNLPAPPGDPTYYQGLHQLAARAVCAETRGLPNSAYDPATTDCAGMPFIEICIHDGQDAACGAEHYGLTIPTACNASSTPLTNSTSPGFRTVEVRTCYQFTPIASIPLLPLDQIWLQRSRVFDIPCYFVLGASPCG